MSTLGISEASFDTILIKMKDLGMENNVQKSIIKQNLNIAVRCTQKEDMDRPSLTAL